MPPAVIIPTYNESDNIPSLVSQILALPVNSHVIVVDDNSPDGTGKLVDEMAQTESRVHAVHRPAKMGLGTAHIAGMRRAFELNFDPIISMDADFSHHPRYIPGFAHALGKFRCRENRFTGTCTAAGCRDAHSNCALSVGAQIFLRARC